ncbi:MAG TPA: 2-oxoglutarate dehydrogenase complex dihydrolipoyllysine-residue succinyltransferase [Gammaproteobacteria bacterium]|nr:2-oxoglutarate dehydrogenase complex dihydrolipoyllysine-residue succinyltransferase [Gammaproteobacteria bacterium]
MEVEVRVPTLPESVQDATLADWHKQPGDRVERDEVLVDLETDKVVFEVPAPQAGILREIRHERGATVKADEVIAVIEPGAAANESAPEAKAPATASTSARGQEQQGPAVRRLLEEYGLDAADIAPSGKDGRLTKADVLAHLEAASKPSSSPRPVSTLPVTPAARPAPAPEPSTAAEGVRRVPMSRLRARIAERMVQAQQTAAILTTFNEVNLQAVMDLRKRHREAFEKRHGVKLGFMSFFIKAAVEALKRFPIVNASVEGEEILYHDYYDIGVAVSTERGLVVPVLRGADRLGFADMEAGIADFAARARDAKLTMEDLDGGTFTITNGGVFGSLLSTPILNPPQSAVLGMHKIQERPVAEQGQVVVRPMMYLALSYDHRIIDGRDAVQFLVAMKENLEDPARLLLQL